MAGKKKIKEEIKAESKIVDILNSNKKDSKVVQCETKNGTVSVLVENSIPFYEAQGFIDAVVENCFTNGIYFPFYKNISIAKALIVYFTDLELTENDEDVYKLMNETTLIEDIKKNISMFQMRDLLSSIDEAIAFEKEKSLKNSKFETMMVDLGDLISLGLDKLSKLDLTKINFEKINTIVDGIASQIKIEPEKE